jgi:LPXTG-motif cell wall-anchored protein
MYPVKGTVAILSISRNKARSVRILGVAAASAALALGAAGNALACNIQDFSAKATCNGDKVDIVVTDVDSSKTEAHVSVFQVGNEKPVAEGDVAGSRNGETISFEVPWQPDATYRVHVKTKQYNVDDDIKPDLTPSCTPPASTPPASTPPASTPPASPEPSKPASQTPTPSASESTTPPAAAPAGNAPSPAVGASNLAETGASSNTGLIAGIAAALVVVGGGAVFFGLRRRGANNAG